MNQFPLPKFNYGVDSARQTMQLAARATRVPRVPWDKFLRNEFHWKSGEHIGLIGPTGQGKTTLLHSLLNLKPFVTVFSTKPRDQSMQNLIEDDGYVKLERWKSLDPREYPRRIVWPNAARLNAKQLQQEVFEDAFDRIYVEGNWVLAIDELYYFVNMLNFGTIIKQYLTQARSLDISLIAGTQRPAWVPRELYTSATHLFFWRVNEKEDLNSISGIGALDSTIIRDAVMNLEQYQCLYINTRSGYMCRTKAPKMD